MFLHLTLKIALLQAFKKYPNNQNPLEKLTLYSKAKNIINAMNRKL
jgi:hypothetical protein